VKISTKCKFIAHFILYSTFSLSDFHSHVFLYSTFQDAFLFYGIDVGVFSLSANEEKKPSFFQKVLNVAWLFMDVNFGFEKHAKSWENHVMSFYFAF